jgi:chromosome segregation ATPase
VSIDSHTTVTKWLASIATALLIIGVAGSVGIALRNEHTLASLEARWADHALEDERTAAELERTRQQLHSLEIELRRPGGTFRRFTSDDGAKLLTHIERNEDRIRATEQRIIERDAKCKAEERRMMAVEAKIDEMWRFLFNGKTPSRYKR